MTLLDLIQRGTDIIRQLSPSVGASITGAPRGSTIGPVHEANEIEEDAGADPSPLADQGSTLGSQTWLEKSLVPSIALIAVIAVSIFSAVLIGVAVIDNRPFLDLIVLFAFQQSLPRFIFICVLGYAGLFGSFILKVFLGGR